MIAQLFKNRIPRGAFAAIIAMSAFILAGLFAYLYFFADPYEGIGPIEIPREAWHRDIGMDGYADGAPIGGFGAGSVTWRYDGSFYDGRLAIGKNNMDVNEYAGFYMYQKPVGGKSEALRLDAASIGTGQAEYYSLFPRAWVDYYGDKFICKAKVMQFSPVLPGNYQTSSYPAGIYVWEISNPTSQSCNISIMMTWKNNFGYNAVKVMAGGAWRRFAGIRIGSPDASADGGDSENGAVSPDDVQDQYLCEFSIGSVNTKGVKLTFGSAYTLEAIAADFANNGMIGDDKTGVSPGEGMRSDAPVQSGENVSTANTEEYVADDSDLIGAVCVSAVLKPGQRLEFPITLTWDMPVVEGAKGNDWYREYTKYFGRMGHNSWKIACDALAHVKEWENKVAEWQNEILSSQRYPEWLKTALFNELYYYLAGGTVWEAGAASGQPDNSGEDMFDSLECYEYPYYGTLDVRFYGSWALLELWPELDKQCIRQFCDSVCTTRTDRPEPLGTAAHDFGAIGGVFRRWNAYNYSNTTNWKDLNPKLVLMVYRDWALTGKSDSGFLNYCWPAVKKAIEKAQSQDADGDGLPDSSGIDQTYDRMSLAGDTAYCGGLYLAACEAAREIAKALEDTGLAGIYNSWFEKGKESFIKKLWNGRYYNIDTSGENPLRIMSDQLCGQWYAKACGLPGIVPDTNARLALSTIYENNFKKFDNGKHGIANVMLPSGEIDESSVQSSECWVGTSWGVVTAMVMHEMQKEADEIGRSLYDSIWDSGQLWFRTPEAWQSGLEQIRAPYYMRATAIWAVKQAYDSVDNATSAPHP